MAKLNLFFRGKQFSLDEAVDVYANIHRITNRDIKYRSSIGGSFDDVFVSREYGEKLTHQEALDLVFKLRAAICEFSTGYAALDQFCKSIVDVDVMLPRQVVDLVVEEIKRLEVELETESKTDPPNMRLAPQGSSPRIR